MQIEHEVGRSQNRQRVVQATREPKLEHSSVEELPDVEHALGRVIGGGHQLP